jgi:hypothetical protein
MASPAALQLGDIVQLAAPARPALDRKPFLVEYLGHDTIVLRGEDGKDITLGFKADGTLKSRAIKGIIVLDRAREKGYARQHGITPGAWVTVYFDDVALTGRVMSLD